VGRVDETNPSLWVATTDVGDYADLDGDERADVVVVGAGITGLTTARLLVEQGASVTVIDAGPICAGATGYTTAKVTSLHGLTYTQLAQSFNTDLARLYGQANEAAIAEIARLVELDGIDCQFERRAHIAYATDSGSSESLAAEAQLAASLGLPSSHVSDTELPFDIVGGVRFDNQAQFLPALTASVSLARSQPRVDVYIRTPERAISREA
jgi:glycine/D-amino acid oxidase-like deaminating enzyme